MKVLDRVTNRVVPGPPRSRAWVAELCPIIDATPEFERLYVAWVEAEDEWRRTAWHTQAKEFAADAIDRTETALIYAFRDLPTGYRSFVVAGDRVVWLRLNRDMLPVCVTHGPRSLPTSASPRGRKGGAA